MDMKKLSERQLDGLREVASIGSGHAATALSQLVKKKVMVTVPTVKVISIEEVATLVYPSEEVVAGILFSFLGGVTGRSLVLFSRSEASYLLDVVLSRVPGETKMFAELESSALKEVSSILTCSYLTALSSLLGFLIIPSVPTMVVDMAQAILTAASVDMRDNWDCLFCVETEFDFEEEQQVLRGYFILMPDPDSLDSVLKALCLD